MSARGVVAQWSDEDGWGVIDSAETPGGCWAHFSHIDVDGYRSLTAGQGVTFTFEAASQDGFRWRAVHVRPDATRSHN